MARAKAQRLAADLWAVGIHGVTGRPVDEGTLTAGTRVRRVTGPDEAGVTRFEASTDGRLWYRHETHGRVEAR